MTANMKLAIVIPAYKGVFLRDCLQSIISQTNKNFNVYIGDDASPDNIHQIVEEYNKLHTFHYQRFDENLGKTSLTRHWERCIALSQNEPYIWLFSDDDIMPPNAVESFYSCLSSYPDSPVFRFNLKLINANGKLISENRNTPQLEKGIEFIKRRLRNEAHSSVVEFVFSRYIYTIKSGYVDFPLAWSSDTATCAYFAGDEGIRLITGTSVFWRTSDSINISSSQQLNNEKFESQLQFIQWIARTYPKEFITTEFKKLIASYLLFTCTQMLHCKVDREQIWRSIHLYKSKYGSISSLFLIIRLYFYLKIFHPYKRQRRRLKRLVYNAWNE
jgi:glycosyltransferase involved in cell wall biosynthesis